MRRLDVVVRIDSEGHLHRIPHVLKLEWSRLTLRGVT
jgi:hypothetical protein